jgi:hypothetical protein
MHDRFKMTTQKMNDYYGQDIRNYGQDIRKGSATTRLATVQCISEAHHDGVRLKVELSSFGAPENGNDTGNGPENHPPSANLALPRRRLNTSAVSSSHFWRGCLAASVAAFGLVLLASPSYAQTVPAANAPAVIDVDGYSPRHSA